MPISRSRWSTDRSLRRLRTRKQHPHHGRRIAETFRGIVGRHLEVEGILKGAMSTQRTTQELRLEFARLAASSATIQERAAEILEQLGRIVAFDVGWLAMRDPELRRHVPLATAGDAEPLRDYFVRPEADDDVESWGSTDCGRRSLPARSQARCRRSGRGANTCSPRVSARALQWGCSPPAGGTSAS